MKKKAPVRLERSGAGKKGRKGGGFPGAGKERQNRPPENKQRRDKASRRYMREIFANPHAMSVLWTVTGTPPPDLITAKSG